MFKYLLVLFFLIVFSQNALTQRLKIESGVSFSSTKKLCTKKEQIISNCLLV